MYRVLNIWVINRQDIYRMELSLASALVQQGFRGCIFKIQHQNLHNWRWLHSQNIRIMCSTEATVRQCKT